MIRWIIREIKSIIETWQVMLECEIQRRDALRRAMIDAAERRDYELYNLLMKEMTR